MTQGSGNKTTWSRLAASGAGLGLLLLLCPGLPGDALAQDTTRVSPSVLVISSSSDSSVVRPPVTPFGGFFRSLLIPGWAQARLNRRLTGGLFIAFEGLALGMTIKASRELAHLRAEGSDRVEAKEQERQDWIVLLAFNHLFAGLEAFVGAHLWDFPADVRLRAAPPGVGPGFQVSIPVRFP